MADKQFMTHLYHLQETYIPHHSFVDTYFVRDLELAFEELGMQVRLKTNNGVARNLWYITTRCLDAMRAADYGELFQKIESLHTRKNAGYAGVGAQDAWANFRMAEWFGVTAFTGCLIRMTDKFIRIKNLRENPAADQVGEAMTDTLFDLAIYSVMALCLWEELHVPTSERQTT